ncbi:alpha-amylase/4-alpha-glucanotransferase domain-containing protein [Tengunoibacter tsumagoiensis]|uniref:Alpha-amylase n=1 Tax=Tengunoibacter tsumagoiensis TaxID=2014871 RepID=A0A401ZZ94_9CHLR|nr:alpha-amylase/4-alpha-glucanotransferase domain-containing protein [Tengunoibacter tsumagoiensis]GCE12142.1 alpha-amylase [Tengunoibacter tsumagoiensis]
MTGQSNQPAQIQLGLLLHNHQPVGNFPWVFQQVYEEAYLPMIEALEKHPGVRLTLHYTGSLLDWLEGEHPEFIRRVVALVQRNQVEIAGGGYYEPILPSIPDRDKVGQIRRLSERIKQDFGTKPTGMWLAERVWEPGLPNILHEAEIQWTILDDIHFKNVGLDDDDLYGYYATEDQGNVLKVYATSKSLRYTIPWRPVAETIENLRSLATPDGRRIVVMGDDGEKFGSWPDTGTYCWGSDGRDGWVEEFFTALEANSAWLHTTPLGEYAKKQPALGRVYIPTSSYLEMTEWALPAQKSYEFTKLLHQLESEKKENVIQFMRGGFWRYFLVRYPEINNQHKKMLRVFERVQQAGATEEVGQLHLWKAQANDTYWHGLFGGIYMGHVRSAIYHHLIKAENAADRAIHGPNPWQHYEFTDFDRDTLDKLIIEGDQQNLYFDPLHGGTLFEWDLRRSCHALTSVMTRREESYHQTLRDYEAERRQHQNQGQDQSAGEPGSPHTTIRTKEADLDQYLVNDRYRRTSLLDHFLPSGLPLKNFAQVRYEESGNFVNEPYQTHVEQDANGITVTFKREGHVKRAGALSPMPVTLSKTIFVPFGAEQLHIRYQIHNQGQARLDTTFASEWNLNLLGGGQNPQAYYRFIQGSPTAQESQNLPFDSSDEVPTVYGFRIGNTWLQQDLSFTISQPATHWRFSIETVTGSEAGFERTHQGSCFALLWPLALEAGQSWQVELRIEGRDTAALTGTQH